MFGSSASPHPGPDQRARRYVAWLKRRAIAIIAAHVLLVGLGVYLIAFHLPLFADFSYLLPQDVPAVRDLRKLEARVKATDAVLVVIQATTPAERALAVDDFAARCTSLDSSLVAGVDADDTEMRTWLKSYGYVLLALEDLKAARDALKGRIKDAKLRANPLYVDLDDDPASAATAAADKQRLDDLRARRAKLDRPTNVSADGLVAMIQVRMPFRSTDAGLGQRLIDDLSDVRAKVVAAHPGVEIGFTGSVITTVAEHGAIFKGMVLSSLITGALVALVLALYFRSATLLVLLIGTLGIATVLCFGAAALTVGHLNAATAFLGAIIAGNGVNYGILLIARYLEERRRLDVDEALAAALVGTWRPTAVAALGASIAYGSLAATSFKGFADFAVIGAVGMVVCWIASYLLLPALMLVFGRSTRIHTGMPVVGTLLVRLIGFRRSNLVVGAALALGAISAVVVGRYIAADPFEYNIKNLRSEGKDAVTDRRWMAVSDKTFGRGFSGRTYIAADRLDQVPMIVDALQARDKGVAPENQTIGEVVSIKTFVADDQAAKRAVLDDIRAMLDDDALDAVDEVERKNLRDLRPPDGLAPITIDNLPASVREKFTEKDGRVGYLISIRPANRLNEWNGHDLLRFANAVRTIKLRDGETVTTSGTSVIFADIVASIESDGPIVTLIAAGGLVLMVLLLVGWNRRAAAVLIGTGAGSLLMVAACALLGLKVNFLDFVALPITLGLGVDYAINVAHRQHHEEFPDPIHTLRTSGSAVFVCSLTTIIGYGSLLISENLAIRGFGTASLIGEVTCLFTALVLVPAILAVGTSRSPIRAAESAAA